MTHAGGAIFVDSGSQSNITGSFFSFNTAGQSGGAVSQADSVSVIDTCQFNSNSGSTQGGALFQNNMTGSVTSCTFLNNSGATGVCSCNSHDVTALSCERKESTAARLGMRLHTLCLGNHKLSSDCGLVVHLMSTGWTASSRHVWNASAPERHSLACVSTLPVR